MKAPFLDEVLSAIRFVKIAIVGDFCLDAYWFTDESKSEISIETGLPTIPVKKQNYSLGGAGNVANNLSAMGVKSVRAYGVSGPDPFGAAMTALLEYKGISAEKFITQAENWSTHVYVKPYSGDEERSRIDFGNFNILSENTADELISKLEADISDTDLVIINEQVASGIHTDHFRKKLKELIARFPDKLFIADSRHYTGYYEGAIMKMNDSEAAKLYGIKKAAGESISAEELSSPSTQLSRKYKKPLFITRGNKGSVIADGDNFKEINGLMILSRVDTVGAGDSYLAGVAAALAAGYSSETAAQLGTLVAGVTVQKLFQTGTATPDEIRTLGKDPDYLYNPDLADDLSSARYHNNTGIEIINRNLVVPELKYAIFDNDGTLSILREGWEKIMEPVMIRAIAGESGINEAHPAYENIRTRVREVIDKTTGVQTLMQMKILTGLVREFNLVPESKILNEHGYKKLFNDELMKLVESRIEKLKSGELDAENLTVLNSVRLVERLYNKGIRLYLTSGTDADDVIKESEALGYAHFFEGRIYGSVGDLKKEAKKDVIDRLLNEIGNSGAKHIVTFGDGPVEIRETRKRGGFTVGVASNELTGCGMNTSKRTRIIKAGADLLVPDFSELDAILDLLRLG
jgi:rfaE bifunctional protein kinase chain/domain